MVKVQFNGRLGNQLFQYTFGRFLAETYCQHFSSDPIKEFPELPFEIGPPYDSKTDRIILNGYFEDSYYYEHHRHRIARWFNIRPGPHTAKCAIHIRGGDAAKEGFRCPPVDYYRKALAQCELFSRDCKVFTDDPSDPVVNEISNGYAGEIVCTTPLDDFYSILNSSLIIIGNSTFAWWSAFLSGHNNIIQPEPATGWRSVQQPDSCLLMSQWTHIPYETA